MRSLSTRVAFAMVFLVCRAGALSADVKFVESSPPGTPMARYLVTLDDAAEAGDDGSSMASDLARAYGGRVEMYARQGFRGFLVTMSPDRARLLSADHRVKLVEEVRAAAAPPRPASIAPPQPAARMAPPLQPVAAAGPLTWSTGTFAYDGSGNITSMGPNSDGKTNQYSYDGISRLVSATAHAATANNTQQFTYDPFGNMTQIVASDTGTLHLDVDSGTNRLRSSATGSGGSFATATYDVAGNQISLNSSYFYGYDAFNMMTGLTGAGRADIFVYDADDERVAVVKFGSTSPNPQSAIWSYMLRDQTGRVLRAVDDTVSTGVHHWKWIKDYVYGNGTLVAAVLPLGALEQRQHFHLDHVSSTRLLTDDQRRRIVSFTYWPYGKEAPGSEASSEPMRFATMERDTSDPNGLDYAHARYHGPSIARYLSLDRASGNTSHPHTMNRYAYAGGNPMKHVDVTGERFIAFSEADQKFYAHYMALATRNRDARELIVRLAKDPHPYAIGRGTLDQSFVGQMTGRDLNHPAVDMAQITVDPAKFERRYRTQNVDPSNYPTHFNPEITILHELKHVDDFFYHNGSIMQSLRSEPDTALSQPVDVAHMANPFEQWAQIAANTLDDPQNALSEQDVTDLIQLNVAMPFPPQQSDDSSVCEVFVICADGVPWDPVP